MEASPEIPNSLDTAHVLPCYSRRTTDGRRGGGPSAPGPEEAAPRSPWIRISAGLLQELPQNSSLLFCCLACDQNAAS